MMTAEKLKATDTSGRRTLDRKIVDADQHHPKGQVYLALPR
jgi:hypothetical protein